MIETFGSAPRPVGSHLVVEETGRFMGSVSAGCVEGEVITAARDVIDEGASRIISFGVGDDIAWRAGLSCGGRISVFVQKLDDATANLLEVSNSLSNARCAHAIATPLDGGASHLLLEGDALEAYSHQSGIVTHNGVRWFIDARAPATAASAYRRRIMWRKRLRLWRASPVTT